MTSKPRKPINRPRRQTSALVLINAKSGTVRARGARQTEELVNNALSGVFAPLDVILFEGDPTSLVKKAIANRGHDVIIAGGGDGTISSCASLLVGSGLTLGALPLGTMNLFVQAAGFSPVLEAALEQLKHTHVTSIDVSFANERAFLHQVSFGLQPRMAKLRERIGYRSRLTKMLGSARAFLVLAMRPKLVRAELQLDGVPIHYATPLLAITNNPIGAPGKWSLQESMDSGILGIYALPALSTSALLRLAKAYLANAPLDEQVIEKRTAKEVAVRHSAGRLNRAFNRRRTPRSMLASIDGEVALLDQPVTFQIRHRCLKILSPVKPGK